MMSNILKAGGVLLGLGYLLREIFKSDPELTEIEADDIFKNFLIFQDEEQLSERILKQRITRSINTIIKEAKGFKIGKSGNPKNRKSSYDYRKYHSIYVLYADSDEDNVAYLEALYNNKYINHRKNDNKREGSAGVTSASNGQHYLYIAVR